MLVNGKDVTEKKCTKCGEVKSIDNFSPTKRFEDGSIKYVSSWCNWCKNETQLHKKGGRVKPIPVVTDEGKECLECHVIKSFDNFSPAARGRMGVSAYCKPCMSSKAQRKPEYKEKNRESMRSYRKRHQARWRAKHRLHQFKRRQKIEATDDGTVDDVVLDIIYRLVYCYWCQKETIPEERTLEHIKELSEGGEHTLDNVAMACRSCNSARKGRTKK